MPGSKSQPFLLILFLLFCYSAGGQTLSFQNYTSENGISQNSGYAIAQTNEGFMWLGTQNGLDRYDSHVFTEYKHIENDSTSLCNNFVAALCKDAAGNLWVGTRLGISIYNPNTNIFYKPSVFFKCVTDMDKADIKKIKRASDNQSIWIITKNEGVFLFNIHTKQLRHFFTGKVEKYMARDIVIDSGGNEWFNTEKDIYKFNGKSFDQITLQKTEASGSAILQDMLFNKDVLWVGSINNGLFKLQANSNNTYLLKPVNMFATGGGLAREITRINKDKRGNIWVGTAGTGMFIIDSTEKKITHCYHDAGDFYSLKTNYILSSFEDAQGIMWIGTSGGGFAKYDPKKLIFTKAAFTGVGNEASSNMIMTAYNYGAAYYFGTLAGGFIKTDTLFTKTTIYKNKPANTHSLLHNTVYGITRDCDGIFWLATKAGLCSYNGLLPSESAFTSYAPDANGLQKYFYTIIKLQLQNALLVCGYNGVFKFDLNTKKWAPVNDPANFTATHLLNTRYITEQPDHTLLLCTEGFGLVKYDYVNGVFTIIQPVLKASTIVRHVLLQDSTLWIATDNGLLQLDATTYTIKNVFNTSNILTDNVVYAVLPGLQNNIWLSTNTGLALFNYVTKKCKYFDESYGLQSMEFNTACCFKTSSGKLCFGGINGINIFNPLTIGEKGYLAPVVITGITVMNKPFKPDSNVSVINKIVLPYDENFITIAFATTNFSHSEKNNYSYRMVNVDKNWVNAGTQHTATYTQLEPGSYQFIVKAANSDGQWSDNMRVLNIVITPQWWRTIWFKNVAAVLAVALLYILYISQIRRVKKEEAFKARLLEYELKALHAQMNPHFIFNCLASIRQLIVDNEKTKAAKYINKFSKLIRATLEHSKKSFISIHDNNEYLANYMELEQFRFGSAFSFRFKIEDGVDEQEDKLPPMMMQPLVENAIWHGIMPSKNPGQIIISYKKFGDRLLCTVDDNGVGIGTEGAKLHEHQSYGIGNIQQRLQLLGEMYSLNCTLNIINKRLSGTPEDGTLAMLTIIQHKKY